LNPAENSSGEMPNGGNYFSCLAALVVRLRMLSLLGMALLSFGILTNVKIWFWVAMI